MRARNDVSIGRHLLWYTSRHHRQWHCAISKKSCEKVAGKRRLCGKMWQGEESRGAIGNSSSIDPQKVGVAFVPSERVIMIPLRPKNVGPSLRRRGHFAAISLPGVKSKIGQAGKICSQGR